MEKIIRCAIYTRKSTDDGLDKEFNTLEAQREAGSNYIRSQKHQGWQEIAEHYDDGGYSGGNLERPALKKLLLDIEAGKIDMVVVYKIDRLTRSLMDFSKLVEIFDSHQCSFISVTQNFNTYDSMGRLTLNVLLSFAQFEREVLAERVRDKVVASKKKGMWMGGTIPLGYDVVNKKLVINQNEAKTVRLIFEQYKLHQSELYIVNLLKQKGIKGKMRVLRNGEIRCNGDITHARLNYILKNPIYMGKIPYKDKLYDGLHEPIISEALFNEIQKIKEINWHNRLFTPRFESGPLLQGLLYSGLSNTAMVSTKSNKKNKIYEYYTSLKAIKEGYKNCPLGNIPAAEIEKTILHKLQPFLQSSMLISNILNELKRNNINLSLNRVIQALNENLNDFFEKLDKPSKKRLLNLLIKEVHVFTDHMTITYTDLAIKYLPSSAKEKLDIDTHNSLTFPINLYRSHRGHKKISEDDKAKDNLILPFIIKAFQWQEELNKRNKCIEELAKALGLSRSYVGKVIKLTCLSPEIIQKIYKGVIPDTLRPNNLLENDIPLLWSEQKIKYGF